MADSGPMLDYEKLDVYHCAIENLAFVFRTVPLIPRGYSALVDQWRRASMSVPLNIAEGVGKTSAADRSNRYAIARGEAMECGAILDVVRVLDVVPAGDVNAAKKTVERLVSMLSRMCR
jgi:four helix bundle protein